MGHGADISYGPQGLRARNLGVGHEGGNDVTVNFALPTPVDGTRFNQFSATLCLEGGFGLADAPGGGMNGRVIWRLAGESFERNTQDFLVFPGCHALDLDLSGPAQVVEDETDVTLPGGLRGFGGTITSLRFDPTEDPGARFFTLNSVRLTERNAAAGSTPITFTDKGYRAGTTAEVALEPVAGGAGIAIATRLPVVSGTNSVPWNGRSVSGAVVPEGAYRVRVRLDRGTIGQSAHSVGVLSVGGGTTPTGPEQNPIGFVDAVVPAQSGTYRVQGWTLDQDAPTTVTEVHVYVDGKGYGAFQADDDRPDVPTVFAGTGDRHGYDLPVRTGTGRHQICVFGINLGNGNEHAAAVPRRGLSFAVVARLR